MPNLLSIPNANAANISIYLELNAEFIFETFRLFLSSRCFNMAGTWYMEHL